MRRTLTPVVVATFLLAACGGDDPHEFAGYQREPAPSVGDLSLPDLANPGEDFALRADADQLLALYFGYTNCPDFCPTTLSDLRLATRRLDDDEAARVDVAMVTVDPDRDLPILDDYITSFFDDGHALGTDDPAELAQVSAPFGVQYDVGTADDGEIEVAHTTQLYVIDDAGDLVLTWQFGVSIDEIAGDLEALLKASSA